MRLNALLEYQTQLGMIAGSKWTVARLANFGPFGLTGVSIRPSWMRHPLFVRMGHSSDIAVFNAIFVWRELEFWRSVPNFSPKIILDLGANVGYASAAFLNFFPGAFVLAVEPDPDNAALCRRNLAPYGNRAKVLQGAVWHTTGRLTLSRGTFGDGREWATEVRDVLAGEPGDVVAWDIPALLEMCPQKHADILKIDIEGSERAVFSRNAESWLPRVRNISVELHGAECEKAVAAALAPYRYRLSRTGEYTLYLDLQKRACKGDG